MFMSFYDLFVCLYVLTLFFFFFKQKTAYEMRISDWSSDVYSSDLAFGHFGREQLDHGCLEVAANAGIDLSADRIHQLPCGLDIGRHLRQFEADRLKLAYRLAEVNPFMRVFQRVFQAPPRQTYGACRGTRPSALKDRQGVV